MWLHERASAKGDDTGQAGSNLQHMFADGFRFDIAKGRFTAFGKELGYGLALLLFDFGVDVDKRPANFIRESTTHSRFAAGHKAYQEQAGSALQFQGHFPRS